MIDPDLNSISELYMENTEQLAAEADTQTLDKPKEVVLRIKYNNEYNEYAVQWFENGVYDEDKTAYTDDPEDAKGAKQYAQEWAEKNGYVVRDPKPGERFRVPKSE